MLKKSQTTTNNYLIKQLPKATVFINRRKVIVYVSDKWLGDFELTSTEVIGKNIISLFKNSNPEWVKAISQCLTGLPNQIISESYSHSNSNQIKFELLSSYWHDENENVVGTILQFEDITKRIQTYKQLEKLEIISEDISDTAEIGFWDYQADKDVLFWNNRTKAIHEVSEDYSPNMADALSFYKLGHSRNTISMTINNAISNEVSFAEKLQLITAKGKEIWVFSSGKPIYDKGKFTGMVGTIQNINERQLSETKSKENEHLLRTLIDHLPLNVFIKDLESRKILANKSEVEYCNAKIEDEILGKDDFAFFDKKTANLSRKSDLIVMRDLKPLLNHEMLHTKKDNSTTTFLTSKIPLIDTDGHAYGLVGISLDISDRKKKELELHKLNKITSSQNEKLINFAHIVSHNLRSHSANFSMLLEFLSSEKSETEKQKLIKMLTKASDNLLETLDNLNEVVSIKTSREAKKYINLNSKIAAVTQNLDSELNQNGVEVINTVEDNLKIRIVPAYIDNIITNFMTNAIKYRSSKRNSFVKFSSSIEKQYIVLHIEDNGLGIDLKMHGDKLFGMYKTFHNNKDAKGIGLYITKNQIEAMKGKVSVESTVGKGSTFKIYFNDKN
ncbi:MAG: PAS domain S-box protein [Maribacter sp.]